MDELDDAIRELEEAVAEASHGKTANPAWIDMKVEAALRTLREMRERAVEGWVSAENQDYLGVTCSRFRHGNDRIWPADRPALLLPLPDPPEQGDER